MPSDEPTAESTEPTPPRGPVLRVVRGEPTPEELTALVAVLAARASGAPQGPERPTATSRWADREASLRRPLHPGPGAWLAAALVPGTRTRAAP